ncbi:MAG: hypothetical protein H0W90_07130 [Actinobacteria bacterium]|nr:hypothetical protein [Actinomycetota bacterium]
MAVHLYRASHSPDYVAEQLSLRSFEVSADQITRYLEQRSDVLIRPAPEVKPYAHADIAPNLTDQRLQRIDQECDAKRSDGDSAEEIADWRTDELTRYSRTEHLCYRDEPLFNSRETVAALIRRIKKWHRSVGRPVAGEGFEDLLAGTWRDIGIKVLLAPRNYDGADAHVELQNQWVAMSIKTEARTNPSEKTIQLSSLAPHHRELNGPWDCVIATQEAVVHLARYERMIYLRSTEERFPEDPEVVAHRYSLLELPKTNMMKRMSCLRLEDFAPYFEDEQEAARRNSFTVPVIDEHGHRLFNLTVTRRPQRVSITAIDIRYCDLISSIWTEPIDEAERARREDVMNGEYSTAALARLDLGEDGFTRYKKPTA